MLEKLIGIRCCFVAIFIFIMPTASLFGQSYLQFQSSRGQLFAMSEELLAIQGWPNIYKLEYATVLNDKEYHKYLNSPLTGLSLTFMDHDNEATGKSISLSGFLQPNFIRYKKHDLSGRLGVGLSYIQHPYHEIDNPLQVAIGSYFNYFAESQLIYTYDLSSRFNVNLIYGITHISNGARRLPNKGFNILSMGMGVSYKLNERSNNLFPKLNIPEISYELAEFSHYFYLRGGFKSMNNLGDNVFPAVGLNYTLAYRYHPLGSFTAGLDVDYNEGFVQERKSLDLQHGHMVPFTSFRWAAVVGHELHMNKLSLLTQYALYIRKPHPHHRAAYQRYGLKYQLSEKTALAATLRAHAGRADYMEWSVGRKF